MKRKPIITTNHPNKKPKVTQKKNTETLLLKLKELVFDTYTIDLLLKQLSLKEKKDVINKLMTSKTDANNMLFFAALCGDIELFKHSVKIGASFKGKDEIFS